MKTTVPSRLTREYEWYKATETSWDAWPRTACLKEVAVHRMLRAMKGLLRHYRSVVATTPYGIHVPRGQEVINPRAMIVMKMDWQYRVEHADTRALVR
jgi:hypothetical protein